MKILAIILILFLCACSTDNISTSTESESSSAITETTEQKVETKKPTTIVDERYSNLNEATKKYEEYFNVKNPVVTFTLNNNEQLKLELFPNIAPNSVANFINLAMENKYNGTIFHRIIENFMIQGGATNTTNTIAGEFSINNFINPLKHYRGVISMARTSVLDSATSQFFICHKSSFYLDGNYAAFGGLLSGFDTLDNVATTKTNENALPISEISIINTEVQLNDYDYDGSVVYVE